MIRGEQRARQWVYRRLSRSPPPQPFLRDGSVVAYWFQGNNVGDRMSPVLLSAMLGVEVRWVTRGYEGKVLSIGSIGGAVAPHDLVLGAGLVRDEALPTRTGVTALLVRGPLTAKGLGLLHTDVAFGEPGLLAPTLVPPMDAARHGIALVPHYTEYERVRATFAGRGERGDITVLDVRTEPEAFLRTLERFEVVCASSLHGVVFAEAYGIPALWVAPGPDIVGGEFKYRDYYLGTGRPPPAPLTWSAALDRAERVVHHGDAAPFTPHTEPIIQAFAVAARRARP